MHEILLRDSLLVLVVVKLTKIEEEILEVREFSRYLVWYEMHKFLSSVFHSHVPHENFSGVLQKGLKLAYSWAKIHELRVPQSVSSPLVMKSFPGVEICGFHLQKT